MLDSRARIVSSRSLISSVNWHFWGKAKYQKQQGIYAIMWMTFYAQVLTGINICFPEEPWDFKNIWETAMLNKMEYDYHCYNL